MSVWIFQDADVKTGLEVQDLLEEAPVSYRGKGARRGTESPQNVIQGEQLWRKDWVGRTSDHSTIEEISADVESPSKSCLLG